MMMKFPKHSHRTYVTQGLIFLEKMCGHLRSFCLYKHKYMGLAQCGGGGNGQIAIPKNVQVEVAKDIRLPDAKSYQYGLTSV